MSDQPAIEARENGPLVVKGATRMGSRDGAEIPVKPVMALCRCGGSKTKPFCDGTHSEIGFESTGGTPSGDDVTLTYAGEAVSVTYNPRLCSHAAECGRLAGHVFNPQEKPWIQPDKGSRDEIEAVIAACPSGALKLAPGDGKGPDLMPVRAEITVEPNGPYWILDLAPPAAPRGEGMTVRKYVLCRCGLSGAKPFCDGSHHNKGWSDTP